MFATRGDRKACIASAENEVPVYISAPQSPMLTNDPRKTKAAGGFRVGFAALATDCLLVVAMSGTPRRPAAFTKEICWRLPALPGVRNVWFSV